MPERLSPFNRRIHSKTRRDHKRGEGRSPCELIRCARFFARLSTALQRSGELAGDYFALPVSAVDAIVGAWQVTAPPLGSGGREFPQAVNKPSKSEDHRNSRPNSHNNRLKSLENSTL
jgi:hypothetical protein